MPSASETVRRRRGSRLRKTMIAVALAALAGLTVTPSGSASVTPTAAKVSQRHVCASPAVKHAACLAIVDTGPNGRALSRAAAKAAGLRLYTASDLQAAYRLPSQRLGSRQVIAIVDAYDDPTAATDLAAYRAANGLPACTAAFPCLRKVNQRGGSEPPVADSGWGLEESLDLDMASASCPNCRLLLVEADDNSLQNLALAADEAAKLGANVISNSYGGSEYNGEIADSTHYRHPGTVVVASTGDSGFGVSVPAALPGVVAVGGTALYRDSNTRGWSETAWAGAGSGCSAYAAKPSWQHDPLCGQRAVADVSAVADPNTPVAVYDTAYGGWVGVGGTSVGAPLIAGVYALAGHASAADHGQSLYTHHAQLFDVTSGSNGVCGGGYLCQAVKGYDGPTGYGTPNGIGAF